MGIDCYLYTEKEHAHRRYLYALCNCGEMKWSDLPRSEEMCYIRESYHGGPYFTRALFPECFAEIYQALKDDIGDTPYVDIDIVCNAPPEILWERFRQNEYQIKQRGEDVYNDSEVTDGKTYGDEQTKNVRKFLETYERLWNEKKQPVVYISY